MEAKMCHTCPECGEVCYCDMDDCDFDNIPDDCPHVCQDDDNNDGGRDDYLMQYEMEG
jgi:hypothetical protein